MINIETILSDINGSVKINGVEADNRTINLVPGENTITIEITSEDLSTTKTYTILINQLLDDKEIKIIEIAVADNLFDGLPTINDDKYAVIVINENFPIERKRFTLLHELGHLILDIPDCDFKEEENYCNLFAAEFLFPLSNVFKEFGKNRRSVAIQELIEALMKYGMSIQAIMYRLLNADIISKNQLSNFYRQINFNKELKKVIDKERFETPEFSHRYKQLVYRAYSQELISASKAASLLGENINKILAKEMV